jgi:epoxyqueuosine reductase
MPAARSVIVCAYPYALTPVRDADWASRLTGRIAAYALGADYHDVVKARLQQLCEHLLRDGARACRVHVDAGPLLEKELARRAGLGWYGHNTNLLTPKRGSALLLGCILTDLELVPDSPFGDEHCGTCRACIPACPTGALDSGPTIDARRCISYLTIELRGIVPHSLRPKMGNWLFGCDDCQTICPWNGDATDASAFLRPSLVEVLGLCEEEFVASYGATAVARARRRGFARNAAVALGNSRNPDAVDPLEEALRHDRDPLVRAHVVWALGRIGDRRAVRVLSRVDPDVEVPPVAAELRAAVAAAARGSCEISPHSAGSS